MDIEKLRDQLKIDEGCVNSIYLDHLNLPTCAIGHLITEWDEEYYSKPIGAKVPHEQVDEWFSRDISITLNDCKEIFPDFDDLPEEAQLVIANMCFQLGRPRLSNFVKFIAAINERDWIRAADEMENSRWYKQTTARAERLIARIITLGVPA